jgi:membrane-associated phospholipid phosphatase
MTHHHFNEEWIAMTTASSPHTSSVARPRSILILGLIALILFAAQITALRNSSYSSIQAIDNWWRSVVGQHPGSFESNPVVLFFQFMGQTLVSTVLSSLILLVFLVLRRWWTALYSFIVLTFSGTVMNLALKILIQRERPVEDAVQNLSGPLFGESGTDSFPSGHTSITAALFVIVLVATYGRSRMIGGIISGFLVFAMALERTMANAHWLSDTMGGLLGICAVGFLLWWLMEPKIAPERTKSIRKKTSSDTLTPTH